MLDIQIRKSVGNSRRYGNVYLYAVMVNGHTVANLTSYEEAVKYIRNRYGYGVTIKS